MTNGYEFIAHRGLFDKENGIPENSMPAFARAVEAGLAIELDVRMTLDGQLVVFHDSGCQRMTGHLGSVSSKTYDTLKQYRLEGTEYGIPLFADVLQLVDGRVPLLIEIKNISLVGKLERKLLEMLSAYRGRYIIESFHPGVVWWMKRHGQGIVAGQLVSMHSTSHNPFEKMIMKCRGFYKWTHADFMAYDIRELTPKMSEKFHEQGLKVYGWTVRSVADYKKVRHICDGVIYDTVSKRAFPV